MGSLKSGMEKRKYPRRDFVLPMEYRRMHDPCSRTGLVINLSNGGFLFSCRRDLSVGEILAVIVMFVDDFELAKLDASAKVIWKELDCETDWNEYKYGAEFLFISKSDQEKLTRLLSGKNYENLDRSSILDGCFNTSTT